VTKVHVSSFGRVESYDVKYTVNSGYDTLLHPDLVFPYEDLDRGTRRRQRSPTLCSAAAADKENAAFDMKKQRDSRPRKKKNKTKRSKTKSPARKVKSSKPNKKQTSAEHRPALVEDDLSTVDVPKVITVRPQAAEIFSPIAEPESRPQRQYMLSADKRRPLMPSSKSLSSLRDDADPSPSENSVSLPANSIKGSPIHSTKSIGGGQLLDVCDASEAKTSSQFLTCRVTLRHVYNQQLQNATEFVNDVVKNKAVDGSVAKTEEAAKVAELKPEPARPCPHFNAILIELLQENDGWISEDSMTSQINEIAARRLKQHPGYSAADVEDYVSILCNQDKIMRCDGNIFSV